MSARLWELSGALRRGQLENATECEGTCEGALETAACLMGTACPPDSLLPSSFFVPSLFHSLSPSLSVMSFSVMMLGLGASSQAKGGVLSDTPLVLFLGRAVSTEAPGVNLGVFFPT